MSGSDRGAKDAASDRVSEGTTQPTEAIQTAAVPAPDWKPIVDDARGANKPVHPDIAGKQDAQVVKPTTEGQGTPEEIKKDNQEKTVTEVYTISQGMTVGADSMAAVSATVKSQNTETVKETPPAPAEPPAVADTPPPNPNAALNEGNQELGENAQGAVLAAAAGGDANAQKKAVKAGLASEDDFKEKKEGKDGEKKEGEEEEGKDDPKSKKKDGEGEEGKEDLTEKEKKNPDQLVDELTKRIGSREAAAVLAARDQTSEDGDAQVKKKKA